VRSAKLLVSAVALLLATLVFAKVSVDYDDTVSFTQYKTYAWKKGTPASDSLIQAHIVNAIDAELASKDFTKTNGKPDLYLVVHASTKKHTQVVGSYLGYSSKTGHWGRQHDTATVRIGTLMVDLLDGKSSQLVWRGVATETLSENLKNPKKLIDKEVRKMFKRFPPKK